MHERPHRGSGQEFFAFPGQMAGCGGQALADEIGVPLLGQVPLEPAVAAGGDAGEPVAWRGTGPAADQFRAIARRIIDEVAPPTNMAGCSARLLHLVDAAFAARDAAGAGQSGSSS